MKRLSTFIFLFPCMLIAQTYEVVEISMSGTMTEIQEINSVSTEFGPYVFGNKLYFTSNREFDLFNLGENNWKNSGYLNVFVAEFKTDVSADAKYKDIELVSEKIMADSHTGPLAFSVTGDTIFFTQVTLTNKKNRKDKYRPQLYMSVKSGNTWTNPILLPFNNPQFSFGHPYFDSAKGRLYFSSDKEGGKGGKDIYFADIMNGNWSDIKPLNEVNTSSNELFPYIVDGHLFFASDREGGKGGLDVYWMDINQKTAQVESISGLNTEFDDFGVYIFPGMKTGFISSNKSGNDDIYFLNIEKKITVKNEMAGMFTYRNLSGQATGLKIQLVDENDDLVLEGQTDDKGEFVFRNLDPDGSYSLRVLSEEELNLVIYDKDGNPVLDLISDEHGNFTYKLLNNPENGLPGLIPENMIEPGDEFGHLSGQLIYEEIEGTYPANTEIILYDSKGQPALKTVTDANGNFDFKHLSLKENYILKIEETEDDVVLLIFDVYGNVVAQFKPNESGQFVYRKLNADHHTSLALIEESEEIFELETQTIAGKFQYNKLTGLTPDKLKIYAYDDDGFLLDSTQANNQGEFRFRSLPTGTNILFKLDETDPTLQLDDFTLFIYDRNGKKVAGLARGQGGYFIYKPLGFENSGLTAIKEDSLDIDLALQTNYDVVKVYFDSNKSNVKNVDLSKLNKLYTLLKENPNLRMEINAYADARASDDYNLVLSEKRGQWIVDYMVKKGIPASRFIVNAYGETQLVDETNDALNRRAEIRVY